MTVPKAPVHEDDSAILRKHYIGLARQASSMEPVSETAPVKPPAHEHFGSGVLALDATHHQLALFGCQYVVRLFRGRPTHYAAPTVFYHEDCNRYRVAVADARLLRPELSL